MREGRDKVGARTSDSHGVVCFIVCFDAGLPYAYLCLVAQFLATAGTQYHVESCWFCGR
jgi:hypothetical protein